MKIRTEDAVKPYGNKHRMALELGVHPTTVYHWGEYVPESRAWHLEALRLRKQVDGLFNKDTRAECLKTDLDAVTERYNPERLLDRLVLAGYAKGEAAAIIRAIA